jgi:DNA mismatch repair protein MutS2
MEINLLSMECDENLIQLELPLLLNKLSDLIRTAYGHVHLENMQILRDRNAVEKKLEEVTEMHDLLESGYAFPVAELPDIRPYLEKTKPRDAFLESSEIYDIKMNLNLFLELKRFIKSHRESCPSLMRYGDGIHLHISLNKEIENTIDPKGEIREDASQELQRIRIEVHQAESEQKKVLLKVLKRYSEFSQDDIVTMRDGRLVLGIQQQYVNRIDGIVHGTSGTGATVFIEPMETLHLSNLIQNLKIEERKEQIRILKFLTGLIREIRDDLYYAVVNFGFLDFIHAKARLSILLNASAPQVTDLFKMHILNARHPILSLRNGIQNVVPLTLSLGEDLYTIIITGPNAGGKTVALKTVGLLAIMTQMGLHIPAHPDSILPIFDSVLVDIGDRQNLEQDLSTFSAHILRIQEILREATHNSLVLIDEIGTGTDPKEGSALAIAIIEELTQKRSLTIATTHHGELKAFANQYDGIENASMEFDVASLQPTYRLQLGIPGSSYAFEIARRYGFSGSLLEKASNFLGADQNNLENIIIHLNKRLQEAETERREFNIKLSEVGGLKTLHQNELNKFRNEKAALQKEAAEQARSILAEANIMIEKIVAEIRKTQANKSTIKAAKEKITSLRNKTEKIFQKSQAKPLSREEIHKGDQVYIRGLGEEGEVMEEPDSHEKVWVLVNEVRMKLSINDLEKQQDKKEESFRIFKKSKLDLDELEAGISAQLDLRGMDSYEAIEATNIYLDQALGYGWDEVRIIHGKGSGILRRKINEYLQKDARVEEKRLGKWGEGDTGVTVVKLRKNE